MSDDIKVLQDYHSAYNEIVQPDVMVYQSRYYVRRWKPLLGGNGDAIVMALRSLGYFNRETGETRDGIPIDLPGLAKLCGISVPTLKREFGNKKDGTPTNPSLHRFVQREKNYRRDQVTGQIWREENVYRVKMDDPIHDDDLLRLKEILEARQKGEQQQGESKQQSKSRKAQNEPNGKARMAQNEPRADQNESEQTQSESDMIQSESQTNQNEPTLKTTSVILPILRNTDLTPAAPGVSLSLFSEQEQKAPWETLTEREQRPYLAQAEQELIELCTLAGWGEYGERAKQRQRTGRAKALYEAEQNERKR